jgi:glutaredoxin
MDKEDKKFDKRIFATIVVVLGIALLIGFIVLGSNGKKEEIVSDKPVVTYFYKEDCPFCKKVSEFIAENSLEEVLFVQRKSIDTDRQNQLDLTKKSRACGLDINSVGVPFIVINNECFEGYPDIENKLKEYIL